MRYRGPSVHRPAFEVKGDVIPTACPIDVAKCFSSKLGRGCFRFGRLRSDGFEVDCLDDPSAGPSLSEVLDVVSENQRSEP